MGVLVYRDQSIPPIMYRTGCSILPPKPARRRRSRDDEACLEQQKSKPRGDKYLLKASSMVTWGCKDENLRDTEFESGRNVLNRSLDTSQLQYSNSNYKNKEHRRSNPNLIGDKGHKRGYELHLQQTEEDFSFKRQLSLPNYSSVSNGLRSEQSITPGKNTEKVCRLESPRSRKAHLQRRWDSTTALDKRSLITESLGRCLFYGSENDLLKSTGVLYANQDKVYVHEESGEGFEEEEGDMGVGVPEEISLDKLMSEQLNISDLETIKESPEIHDQDLGSPLNLSHHSTTSSEPWPPMDLDLTVRSADFADMYHARRGHPLTSSTRSKFSCHSLDGLLDRLQKDSDYFNTGPLEMTHSPEETESALEEETESRMRESELWIKDFLNELDDPFEPQEPEFYDLDDFRPTPLPPQKEPKIYSNGFHRQLEERSFRLSVDTSGREFVRTQTVPSIPIESYLIRKDQTQVSEDVPPPLPPRGKTRKTQIREKDASVCNFSNYQEQIGGDVEVCHWNQPHRKKGSAWALDDSELRMSSPESPTPARKTLHRGTQLYYVTPPQSQMAGPMVADGRLDRSSRGGSITRLTRRLSQREKKEGVSESLDHRKCTLRQRSVSLDCGDKRNPLLEGGNEQRNHSQNHLAIPGNASQQRQSERRASSPNLLRKVSGGSKNHKNGQSYDRKRRTQDLQALFCAVENQNLEEMNIILENCTLDINGTNSDQLTPLDMAIFMNNLPMARMLLSYGARENPLFMKSKDAQAIKLISLVREAEKMVTELKHLIGQSTAGNSLNASSQHKDLEKQLAYWEYRLKLNKRMKAGYEYAKRPEPPGNVTLTVTSSTSVSISFKEPFHHNGAVVTMYKVSWSADPGFESGIGEQILENPQILQYEVQGLTRGVPCYCRCQAWNVKGWSEWATCATPAIPSSWRELDEVPHRTEGRLQLLKDLFTNMKNSRPPHAAHVKDQSDLSNMPSRKSNVRKSIKNLFSTAPRFQKTLRRGVYLASVVCCEDRILVTNDDLLPVIEVDENYTNASLNTDFHWLMKIACTWEDVKTLRQDMEKNPTQSSFLFRSKLLQAAAQLQSCLGVQDLGPVYHQPIRDQNGSIVLVTVRTVQNVKSVNTTHLRWVSQSRLLKRAAGSNQQTALEMLLTSIKDMLTYETTSTQPLPAGLYLGYLKLCSSVDMIRIMVEDKLPNVLPHYKIRDNAHVTREEWDWLRQLSLSEVQSEGTDRQTDFQQQLHKACQKLLDAIGISEDEAVSHRLYDLEVIELSEDVSFIMVLPPSDSVCNVPGNQDMLTQRPGYVTLPVKLFEMVHMCTYQYEFISRYCRLSSILEMDLNLAQQAQREAFSNDELSEARRRVDELGQFQQLLDDSWKGMRWTMDIITYARDKSVRGGLPLGVLYAPPPSPSESPNMDRKSDVSSSLCSDPGYHSDWSSMEQNLEQVGQLSQNDANSSQIGGKNIQGKATKGVTMTTNIATMTTVSSHSPVHFTRTSSSSRLSSRNSNGVNNSSNNSSLVSSSGTSNNNHITSKTHNEQHQDSAMCSCEHSEDIWTPQVTPKSGILRIYTAYKTGLSRGTSVKLHVTAKTTSREVINLVVQQLNRAVLAKGFSGPVYNDETLEDFCLVAVVGARERVLRDDFQPLLLQNPWTKGRLFVRLKSNLLAALEQGQVTSV